ncbi:MAG: hypothetical protein WC492_03760 [Candidatus Micrarchaeia archaeon]
MNGILKWLKMFLVWAVIILIIGMAFEFLVFGTFFGMNSFVLGMFIPSAIVYAVLIGVVFATAQFAMQPKMPCPSCTGSHAGYAKKAVKRSKSKKKRR